jgi:hypothetical protein
MAYRRLWHQPAATPGSSFRLQPTAQGGNAGLTILLVRDSITEPNWPHGEGIRPMRDPESDEGVVHFDHELEISSRNTSYHHRFIYVCQTTPTWRRALDGSQMESRTQPPLLVMDLSLPDYANDTIRLHTISSTTSRRNRAELR